MNASTIKNSNNREHFFDIIRGGAALSIVLYHYTTRYDQMIGHKGTWFFNLSWGWMAWAIFFIMTGYFVYPKAQSLSHFIISKAKRLYPGFWASMCVSSFVTTNFLTEYKVDFREFIIDLSMVGNYFGVKSAVGVDWFLSVNIVFYVLIAIIIWLQNKKYCNATKIITIWSGVSSLIMLVSYMGLENHFLKVMKIIFAAQYAHLFSTGYFLKRIKEKQGNKRNNIMFIVFSFVAHLIAFKNIAFEVFYSIIIAVFLYYSLNKGILRINDKHGIAKGLERILVWIAGISYPLYLVHEYLGFSILKSLDSLDMTNEIFIIIPISASIMISYLINKFIEYPIIQYKSKRRN